MVSDLQGFRRVSNRPRPWPRPGLPQVETGKTSGDSPTQLTRRPSGSGGAMLGQAPQRSARCGQNTEVQSGFTSRPHSRATAAPQPWLFSTFCQLPEAPREYQLSFTITGATCHLCDANQTTDDEARERDESGLWLLATDTTNQRNTRQRRRAAPPFFIPFAVACCLPTGGAAADARVGPLHSEAEKTQRQA